jgi:4-hydroxybenzoate polyprenyltransferase
VARLTHLVCAALFIAIGLISPAFGVIYFTGAGLAIVLLITEHALVWKGDLSKVGLAFFTINGILSVVVGTLGVIDVLI